MYQAYVADKGFLTKIFRDRKSAEKWIEEQLKKPVARHHQEKTISKNFSLQPKNIVDSKSSKLT
jgi:hypothetical protein